VVRVSEVGATPPGARDAQVPPWVPRAIAMALLGVVILFVSYRLFLWLRSLLLMLLIAFFVSLAVEPAVNALARRGWRRGLATAVVFVGVIAAFAAFSFTMGQLLVAQVRDIAENGQDYAAAVIEWVDARTGLDLSSAEVAERFSIDESTVAGMAGGVAGSALALAGSALGAVFTLFSVALFAFYLSAEGPRFRRAVCRLMPARYQRLVLEAWTIAIDSTGGYIYSRVALAVVSAVVHWIAFAVIGVPNAFALAMWVGLVSQFVPTVGTYLAGVVPLVVALAQDPLDALWVLLVILAYQQVENYAVAPPLTARTMSLHPAVAFGSVIAGVAVLGPVGALLALPAAASIKAFASSYTSHHEVVSDPLTTLDEGSSPTDDEPAGRSRPEPVTRPRPER